MCAWVSIVPASNALSDQLEKFDANEAIDKKRSIYVNVEWLVDLLLILAETEMTKSAMMEQMRHLSSRLPFTAHLMTTHQLNSLYNFLYYDGVYPDHDSRRLIIFLIDALSFDAENRVNTAKRSALCLFVINFLTSPLKRITP